MHYTDNITFNCKEYLLSTFSPNLAAENIAYLSLELQGEI